MANEMPQVNAMARHEFTSKVTTGQRSIIQRACIVLKRKESVTRCVIIDWRSPMRTLQCRAVYNSL